jgi:hypothetical protein
MYRPRPFYQRGDRVQWIGTTDWIGTVLWSKRVGHEQWISVQFDGTDEPVIALPDKIRRIS